ncbi:hypothetical protein GJU39_14455 [Pedobacter petrophilus]|uniref:Uncharacterized protein n=1 Tax=Pedobacter petrophilus TaxID=1908241 RepID=A0A7K0G0H5_9SPHI|nr:hypothetical protein [Pedobacter petrophilus]MRX77285.1 hypothetical protein [Pedobacter petrophilus]
MENQKPDQEKSKSAFVDQAQDNPAKGLNDWNDRLDENLEPKKHGDTDADERAKDFSDQVGSGDQSDQADS